MDDLLVARLRKLAQKAQKDILRVDGWPDAEAPDERFLGCATEYIAALDPATVTRLLDAVETFSPVPTREQVADAIKSGWRHSTRTECRACAAPWVEGHMCGNDDELISIGGPQVIHSTRFNAEAAADAVLALFAPPAQWRHRYERVK